MAERRYDMTTPDTTSEPRVFSSRHSIDSLIRPIREGFIIKPGYKPEPEQTNNPQSSNLSNKDGWPDTYQQLSYRGWENLINSTPAVYSHHDALQYEYQHYQYKLSAFPQQWVYPKYQSNQPCRFSDKNQQSSTSDTACSSDPVNNRPILNTSPKDQPGNYDACTGPIISAVDLKESTNQFSISSACSSPYQSSIEPSLASQVSSGYGSSSSSTTSSPFPSPADSQAINPAEKLLPYPPTDHGTTQPEHTTAVEGKKPRTSYTADQIRILNENFQENAYPDCDKVEELSKRLDVAEKKVKIWFQNKRARWRKKNATSPVHNSPIHYTPVASRQGQIFPHPQSRYIPGQGQMPGIPSHYNWPQPSTVSYLPSNIPQRAHERQEFSVPPYQLHYETSGRLPMF